MLPALAGSCSCSYKDIWLTLAEEFPRTLFALPKRHGESPFQFDGVMIRRRNSYHNLFLISFSVLLVSVPLTKGSRRDKRTYKVVFSQQELKKRLTPLQYHVTQEKGTESAFKGEFTDKKDAGSYTCVVCGAPLFQSETKFDSGSGWPSFSDVIKPESVSQTDDFSYGMHRVEIGCSQCGAHLGHLFDDGPRPTGKRYCINSGALAFVPKAESSPREAASSAPASASNPTASGKTEL